MAEKKWSSPSDAGTPLDPRQDTLSLGSPPLPPPPASATGSFSSESFFSKTVAADPPLPPASSSPKESSDFFSKTVASSSLESGESIEILPPLFLSKKPPEPVRLLVDALPPSDGLHLRTHAGGPFDRDATASPNAPPPALFQPSSSPLPTSPSTSPLSPASPKSPLFDRPLSASLLAPATLADDLPSSFAQTPLPPPPPQTLRTTVLPKLESVQGSPRLVLAHQERYLHQRLLGEGAMGEVQLAFDQDIQRPVAIKRLKSSSSSPLPVLRFAEEVRIVGQLEHPNIVPIHDVGLSPEGSYYFVMKFVEGETLETILQRLQSGDKGTHQRFTFGYRLQIFLDILKAIDFAHSQGVIHRDLKPANIMIGPHGEVLVMDWGIAKRLPTPTSPTSGSPSSKTSGSPTSPTTSPPTSPPSGSPTTRPPTSPPSGPPSPKTDLLAQEAGRLQKDRKAMSEHIHLQTQQSRLIGTPAYMSPEQAMGLNDQIDARSDLYSLCVVLHEFMGLQHYMEGKTDLFDLLLGIASEAPRSAFALRNPHQGIVPIEISHFITKGLQKDPVARYQTTQEMQDALRTLLSGHFKIQCPTTLMKRLVFGVLHFIDRFPWLAYAIFTALLGVLVLLGLFSLLNALGL